MATSSAPQKESIKILQTECHYLSLALNRLNEKNDPDEYHFLKQKLQAAEAKLHEATTAVDDYSYDDNGPAGNASTYDAEMQEYYAATNSYRQQLQAEARNYGDKKKRIYKIDDDDGIDSSSSSKDSDDSSLGSAHRHVKRHYRKTILIDKSRGVINKYQQKGSELYHKGKANYRKSKEDIQTKSIKDICKTYGVRIILGTLAFVMVVLVLSASVRYRRRNNGHENTGQLGDDMSKSDSVPTTSSISGPCTMLSISLKTDRFGNETSWDITRKEMIASSQSSSDPIHYSESIIKSGGPYSYGKYTRADGFTEQINESICLPVGEYNFILHDTLGDGICCEYGKGQYGLRLNRRAIRPMNFGIFLGKEEITSFEVTENDIGDMGSEITSDSSQSANEAFASTTTTTSSTLSAMVVATPATTASTTTTTTSSVSNNQSSPPGESGKTDDWDDDVIDDKFNGGMGDDSILDGEEDDLISALGSHSDDAIDPVMYYNIEKMDSNADGKVSSAEFKAGSEEIGQHCSVVNIQTSYGRNECERVCGEDHWCCFESSQNGYNCKADPSYACETYKPCEILIASHSSNGFEDNGGSGSRPTPQDMALIEESIQQYCSTGAVGIDLVQCQEICNDHLCCFEKNFGVGNNCESAAKGLCTYYVGCEQLVSSSSNWVDVNSRPNSSVSNSNGNIPDTDTTTTGSANYDEGYLPATKPLTLEEKLQVQDEVDQACSDQNLELGDGQCLTLCGNHMCCFDASELGCRNYNLMCEFYSSCERVKYMTLADTNGFFGNRKRLRG